MTIKCQNSYTVPNRDHTESHVKGKRLASKHTKAILIPKKINDMERNPAYGVTQSQEYESMSGEQTEEYVYVSNKEGNKYRYANSASQENNATDTGTEKKDKENKIGVCQTQKCTLIAIIVTLVITLLIALTAIATAIVALYALGQESIDRASQHTELMEWAQESYNELLLKNNGLQTQVDNITAQMNNPLMVGLIQNCTVETQTCTIQPTNTQLYWRGCLTPGLLISKPNQFTMSMRCLYNRSQFMFESAQLIEREGNVFCSCSVLNPDSTGPSLRALPIDLSGICSLEITRCPR